MNSKNLYDWLFSSMDDIIDCDFNFLEEDKNNVQNSGKGSAKIVNDFGKPGRDNS